VFFLLPFLVFSKGPHHKVKPAAVLAAVDGMLLSLVLPLVFISKIHRNFSVQLLLVIMRPLHVESVAQVSLMDSLPYVLLPIGLFNPISVGKA